MRRTSANCLALVVACALSVPARGASATSGDVSVVFDERTRRFAYHHAASGALLVDGVVAVTHAGGTHWSDGAGYRAKVEPGEGGDPAVLRVRLRGRGRPGLTLTFEAHGDQRSIVLRAVGTDGDGIRARARLRMGAEPVIGFTKEEQPQDGRVLTTTLGPAHVSGARSLFDRQRDVALTVSCDGKVDLRHGPSAPPGAYRLVATQNGQELVLNCTVKPHYYRDTLGIEHYAPLDKSHYWTTAPCVAMTWYGIEGWKGSPAQTKRWLYPQIDWVAEHLLPYGERLVFQLDDNYAKHDDQYMRDISDCIRRRGLIPGIWFTPFTVAPPEVHDEHPDWFVHDAEGKPIKTFGGKSYNGFTLDVTSPEVVERWYGMWWDKVSSTWNFDFFKIDGQPSVIGAYNKAVGVGLDDYRHGLDIGRQRVGPGKFINGCWGIPLGAIGKVNGSRIGGDTGNHPHAINVMLRWNFLNNVVWWCDPDAAANLYRATVERARLNTQARSLTGQQFLTDDVWTRVSPEVAYVWQRGMPNLDIKPANLYPITDWQGYDLFDLKVRKPWGQWDVVGLLNYGAEPKTGVLDLARLRLEPGRYHVYDFWEGEYLGLHEATAALSMGLEPYEGKLFSVHADMGKPLVLSTSRHISQGGLDLERISVRREGKGYAVEGRSSHLVAGDDYVIAIAAGGYVARSAHCDAGPVATKQRGDLVELRIAPSESGEVRWRLRLTPAAQPQLSLGRTLLYLAPADYGPPFAARVPVRNLGPGELAWTARTDVEWLSAGRQGDELVLTVEQQRVEPGARHVGKVVVTAEGAEQPPQELIVHLRTPAPPNLARRATATASSAWSAAYEAARVNDGAANTRWNAARGDENGCWVMLAWPQAQTFDMVVVNEVLDWGPRIQQWALEARTNGDWEPLAKGSTMGARRIELPPTTATALRLTMPKATDTPTISEIRVERRKPGD